MRVHMPSQSGDDRLVPAPCWSMPLPVATSPEIAATSGVARQSGAVPGRYGLPLWSVTQLSGATPSWNEPAGSFVLLPPPPNSHAVSETRCGGLPPSLLSTVPPTATAYVLADG